MTEAETTIEVASQDAIAEPCCIHIQSNLNANLTEPDSPEEWLEWASWWA